MSEFKITKSDYENGTKRINLLLPIKAVEALVSRAEKEGVTPTTKAKMFVLNGLNLGSLDNNTELPGQTYMFDKSTKRRNKK